MSNAATITAVLELQRGNFRTEQEKTTQELGKLQGTFKDAGAAVAFLERQLASDKGNKALQDQLKAAGKEFRELGREMKLLENQKKALDRAIGEPTPLATQSRDGASRAQATVRRSYEDAGGEGGGGRHMPHGTGAQLMHSGRAVVEMMAAGQSPVRALEVEAPRILQAMAPLIASMVAFVAPLLSLVGGGVFIKWLADAKEEAKALRFETAGIATGVNNIAGASAENLQKTLEAAMEQRTKVTEKRQSFGNRMVNTLTGQGVNDRDVGAANAMVSGLQNRLDSTQGRKVALDQRAFAGDPAVESERLQTEFAEKRNQIFRDVAAHKINDGREAVRLAQEELDLNLAILERRQQMQRNTLDEEVQNIGTRRLGRNVEGELAADHLRKTQADLAAGPQQGPEWEHNRNQVWAAENAKGEADHRRKEHDDELALRTRNANLRGNPDDVAYQSAVNKRDAIQGKIDDPATKDDEKKQLQADLAEAKSQMHGLALASHQKAFSAEKAEIQTNQGRGPQARLDSIGNLLALNAREQDWNTKKNGDDPMVAAQLRSEAHALDEEKKDIVFQEQQALTAAKAQTAEMQLRAGGHANEAQLTAIRAQYEEKIAGYLRDGKTDLAQQAALQGQMAVEAAKLAQYRRGPAGEMHDRMQAQADERDKARMYAKEDRDTAAKRRRYEEDHRKDLPLDPRARADAIARGSGTEPDRRKDLPLDPRARADAIARGSGTEPDRRGVATADPQKSASAKDDGSAPVVSSIDKLYTLIDSRLHLTIP